jgi:hypothetical protein
MRLGLPRSVHDVDRCSDPDWTATNHKAGAKDKAAVFSI